MARMKPRCTIVTSNRRRCHTELSAQDSAGRPAGFTELRLFHLLPAQTCTFLLFFSLASLQYPASSPVGRIRRRMVSPPPPPALQSGARGFSDVVDHVLRFVQQPSSNLKNLTSGSAKDLDTNFNRHTGPAGLNVDYSPKSSLDAGRGTEHGASPLSPSRTLVASGSSNSSSSTPRSRYRSLKRTESAGSTSSSASRSTETQNRSAEGRNGKRTEKDERGKRLNVGDRLRRLGRKMQSQKSSLSSPKVSAGELVDDSERDPRIGPRSAVNTQAISSTLDSRTGERAFGKTPEKGKGKELRAPRAHAKLLSMVVEADESSTNVPSSSSSGFSKSGATTPTAVQTPRTQNYGLSTLNDDDQPRVDPPEPMTLAARIQALIAGLPFPSLPGASASTVNNTSSSQPEPTSGGSPQFHYSPEVSSWSSPLPVSPSPLPTSSLPPLPNDYGIDLNVEMDTEGRPIPPPYASPLAPRERMILEEFLSSPVIMNGELPQEEEEKVIRPARKVGGAPSRGSANATSQAQGKERPQPAAKVTRSIWSVLESMGSSIGRAQVSSASPSTSATSTSLDAPASPPTPPQSGSLADANAHETESMFSDTGSSVMMYSPLIPSGAQDLPELAETVSMVSENLNFGVYDHENRGGHPPSTSTATPTALGTAPPSDQGFVETASSWIPSTVRQWSLVQAISVWSTATPDGGTGMNAASSTSISTGTTATTTTTTDLGSNEPQSGPTRTSTSVRKAWVPSTTKMSVQAMWWGYRLYLPPPVMAILSDRTLEASKRAALITAALTWFFTNLPITALPPPLQPAALLLQRIAPFLGYIGAFISWSWGVIEGYDVGYGVTLTATWLLPVALIPGTWHKDEFPLSPSGLGQPVRLPQMLCSPAPASDRALEPMRVTPAGPFPARVTEFLPLPTPMAMNSPLASPSTSNSTPVAAAPSLPSSPASLHSASSPLPPAADRSTPFMTLTPMPPTPVSPSRTPHAHRDIELALSAPQSMEINTATAMSSPTLTSSSHYQTPLLSSPAPTASSRYQTPLSSPRIPLSPRLPSSAHSTPLIYRAPPIPEPIPSSPSIPLSLSGTQTLASIHSSSSPTLVASHSSPTYTPRSRPHSKSKSTTTHVPGYVPVPVEVPPVPPATVQASAGSPNSQRKSKAPGAPQGQRHPEIRSSSRSSHAPSEEPQPLTMPIKTSTSTRRSTSRTQIPIPHDPHSHLHSDATSVSVSVPVGSPLEQHLLSGPLMSPVPLPDVDLPVSASTLSPPVTHSSTMAQTSNSVPAPMYAYADKEERDRERNMDRARIRERARAIFRRAGTTPTAGAQKARAK